MANFEFLLTLLPALPANLGDKVSIEEAYRLLKLENDAKIDYLADILSVEDIIKDFCLQYYVLGNKSFEFDLPNSLPDSFKNVLLSYNDKTESVWTTEVYASWFELMVDTGKRVGSSILKEWAKWEYSLRINFMIDRFKKAGIEYDEYELIPEFIRYDSNYDTSSLVDAYNKSSEPMKAERTLDASRLDFIRSLATSYSFSADELVAYMLELRIYERYARLDPEKGRKILQEVTVL